MLYTEALHGKRIMSLDPKRTVAELKELRELTADDNGAQRVAWTDTWLKARSGFRSKIKDLPIEHHYDAAGNSWTTLRGASEKALLIGGHLDSVPNGGWLDGCLDFLAGLEVLRRFAEEFNGRPPVTVRLGGLGRRRRRAFWTEPAGIVGIRGYVERGSRPRPNRQGRRPPGRRGGALRISHRSLSGSEAASRRMRPLTSSCTSSRGRFWSACSYRWAWCWGRKA